MKKSNFGLLLKEEMVSRFDSVLRSQIQEFDRTKENIQQNLDRLEKNILVVKNYCDAINDTAEDCKKEVSTYFLKQKDSFDETVTTQIKYVRSIGDNVQFHLKQLNDTMSKAVLFENFNKEITQNYLEHNQINLKIHKSEQKSIEYCEKKIDGLLTEQNNKNNYLQVLIDNLRLLFNTNLNVTEELTQKVDSFNREMNVLKKSVFIIEKNIENIYTLIERMKKNQS